MLSIHNTRELWILSFFIYSASFTAFSFILPIPKYCAISTGFHNKKHLRYEHSDILFFMVPSSIKAAFFFCCSVHLKFRSGDAQSGLFREMLDSDALTGMVFQTDSTRIIDAPGGFPFSEMRFF